MKNHKTVYIAFGANKGDAKGNILKALQGLSAFCRVCQISPLYLSKPEGFLEQEDFINGALEAKTDLSPIQLLASLKEIETRLGRQKSFRDAPREIDLDIIFYGNEIVTFPQLYIPHQSFRKREFVLLPLKQIAPDFIDPLSGKSVSLLYSELMSEKKESTVRKLSDTLELVFS